MISHTISEYLRHTGAFDGMPLFNFLGWNESVHSGLWNMASKN